MPGENVYDWSVTAANNGTADSLINWAEGMPRAAVNDSARSEMAAVAKYRNLLSGSIVASGTLNAIVCSSGIGYTSLPNGLRILLRLGAGVGNTGACTLNMDGTGNVPIKNKDGTDPASGALFQFGYADLRYDGSNVWTLLSGSQVPIGTGGGTITGNLSVTGDATVSGTLTATSAQTVGGMTVGGILNVTGAATVGGQLQSNGDIKSLSGNLFAIGIAPQLTLWDSGTAIWGMQCANGGITIGTANTVGAITANYIAVDGGSGHFIAFFDADKPGGGLWGNYSDARIKNVLGDYVSGLEQIIKLRPVRYTFKGNDTNAPDATSMHEHAAVEGTEYVGLTAQDCEQVMPEMVRQRRGYIDGAEVDDLRQLDATPLIYALVNAVKTLAARVEALEQAR